ncbi:MAG: hypothetical protein U1E66_06490 [Rhodospirillales bacterium]
MGNKSNKMNRDVATAMQKLKKECRELEMLFGSFCDEFVPSFLAAASTKPSNALESNYNTVQYGSKMVKDKLLKVYPLIDNTDTPLVTFEKFLKKKDADHKEDWTDLKKKSLQRHTAFVVQARSELANVAHQCMYIGNSLEDKLAFCSSKMSK